MTPQGYSGVTSWRNVRARGNQSKVAESPESKVESLRESTGLCSRLQACFERKKQEQLPTEATDEKFEAIKKRWEDLVSTRKFAYDFLSTHVPGRSFWIAMDMLVFSWILPLFSCYSRRAERKFCRRAGNNILSLAQKYLVSILLECGGCSCAIEAAKKVVVERYGTGYYLAYWYHVLGAGHCREAEG